MSSSTSPFANQYTKLPVYMHNLEKHNPSTITGIKRDESNRFELCYVALGSVARTFNRCMLPVVYVGSYKLKGSYPKYLFVAISMDRNHQSLPLAYGVSVIKSIEAWTWFLRNLKDRIGEATDVAFITKIKYSLEVALSLVFSGSYRGYCCSYVASKVFSLIGESRLFKLLFWATINSKGEAAWESNLGRFNYAIEKYGVGGASGYIASLVVEKWVKAFFPKARCNLTTVHVPDVVDFLAGQDQDLPVTSVLDVIHQWVQGIYSERKELGAGFMHEITPYADMVLHRRARKIGRWRVRNIDNLSFAVKCLDSAVSFTANLEDMSCTCGRWAATGIPCRHAISACRVLINHNASGMVASWYTSAFYRAAYRTDEVYPVPPEQEWELPIFGLLVLPPL